MTSDGTNTYKYDAENRLIQVSGNASATYVYDAYGRRARKTVSSVSTDYFRDLSGRVIGEWNGSAWTASYVYLGSLLAEYAQGTTYFPFQDHLGSTRLVTNATGGIVDSIDYLPFGEQIAGGSATSHKFTGDEHDAETLPSLEHTDFRQYSSALGRWTASDPAGFAAGVATANR
jgi:RHS repeat-associated protein